MLVLFGFIIALPWDNHRAFCCTLVIPIFWSFSYQIKLDRFLLLKWTKKRAIFSTRLAKTKSIGIRCYWKLCDCCLVSSVNTEETPGVSDYFAAIVVLFNLIKWSIQPNLMVWKVRVLKSFRKIKTSAWNGEKKLIQSVIRFHFFQLIDFLCWTLYPLGSGF